MAYCTETDVRLYAPQLPAAAAFTTAIAAADGVIDAHLRATYSVPLSTVDQLIKNISARLAAGNLLQSYQAQVRPEGSSYADKLVTDAMRDLAKVASDPGLLSVLPRTSAAGDEDKSGVRVSDDDGQLFDLGPEQGWGLRSTRGGSGI